MQATLVVSALFRYLRLSVVTFAVPNGQTGAGHGDSSGNEPSHFGNLVGTIFFSFLGGGNNLLLPVGGDAVAANLGAVVGTLVVQSSPKSVATQLDAAPHQGNGFQICNIPESGTKTAPELKFAYNTLA
ncbi:hypothetical protein NQ176_g5795 [Zarea fungicola]|uniref:Uncharacterized protein n=1 Tax=Zarea fungicola TaxID=93591 RepID=A0ACC1N7Q5_9HYPO|nr:hypothetical protein NQ176_g5795 [Lecanicillium fungicola]